jgi:carboxypeptidase Q
MGLIRHLLLACLIIMLVSAEKDYTELVKFLKANIEDQKGPFYHSAFSRLAYISDTYGPRMWGSETLEMVISEMASMASKEGFDNIRLEPVQNFTKWIRGKESLTLFSPRPTPQKLNLIGLGKSISGNVKADAIVFRSFDELEANKDKIKGKIVVYNQPWTNYG